MHFQGWGKTVVLGVDRPGSNLTLPSGEVLMSGKTLTGRLFGGLKPKTDVPMLAKRYLDKVFTIQISIRFYFARLFTFTRI